MKRGQWKPVKTALALLAAALWLSAAVAAADKTPGATVAYVNGDVQVKRSGAGAFESLPLGELLYEGDEVRTGASSRASLATKGGAEVRLNENSTFTIEAGSRRNMFSLGMGQIWTKMLTRMAKLNVRTPSAVCAVRGTEADIEQRSLLTVKVYEGHVDLENSLGKQSLAAGQMSTVSGAGAAPAAAKQMSASDIGNWQEGATAKDMQAFLNKLSAGGGNKKLKLRINKGGKTKDMEIKLKKK